MFLNTNHAFAIFKNWSGCHTDPQLQRYFFNKAIHSWFYDAPQYNYWYISLWAVGISVSMSLRHFLFNPDVNFRRQDKKKNIVDRWQHHLYSLPYYNHHIRNFSQLFIASLVDNEPDYARDHPWGIRPRRNMFYGRFPLQFSCPKYFVDHPEYKNALHSTMEKKYAELGYHNLGADGGSDSEE